MQREKAFHDSYHGTFGSAEGRKHFAKNAALGGAKVLTNLIAASFDASQGNELGLASLTSGNSHFQEAFNGQGVERYREFRELLEKGEKERLLNAEAGMDAGNALESDAYSVRSDDAHMRLWQDLSAVIKGVADDSTRQRILKEMESGKVSGSKDKDDQVSRYYKMALRFDAELSEGKAEIEGNSEKFMGVIAHFVQQSHLTNEEVETMLQALTLTVNKEAAMFYSKNKPRIEALLKAELLGSTNLKIKK